MSDAVVSEESIYTDNQNVTQITKYFEDSVANIASGIVMLTARLIQGMSVGTHAPLKTPDHHNHKKSLQVRLHFDATLLLKNLSNFCSSLSYSSTWIRFGHRWVNLVLVQPALRG